MFLSPEIVDETERFVDTLERAPEPETVLATVLFTDLVGSSERASELGDRELARAARSAQRHDQTAARTLPRRRARHRRRRVLRELRRPGPRDPLRSRDHRLVHELWARGPRRRPHRRVRARLEGKPTGIAVNTGARVAAAAGAGEVLVTEHGQGPRRRLGHRVRGPRRARAEGRGSLAPLLCSRCLMR